MNCDEFHAIIDRGGSQQDDAEAEAWCEHMNTCPICGEEMHSAERLILKPEVRLVVEQLWEDEKKADVSFPDCAEGRSLYRSFLWVVTISEWGDPITDEHRGDINKWRSHMEECAICRKQKE